VDKNSEALFDLVFDVNDMTSNVDQKKKMNGTLDVSLEPREKAGGGAGSSSGDSKKDWIGHTFFKDFPGHGCFQGKVVKYLHEEHKYLIEYEDGDEEQLEEIELKTLMSSASTSASLSRSPLPCGGGVGSVCVGSGNEVEAKNVPQAAKAGGRRKLFNAVIMPDIDEGLDSSCDSETI
jgi:hypothetical protein